MKLPRSYDIEIRSNGNEYGFMLQAKDGRKNWNVNDLSILPPSLITGSATYANIAPEQKILLEADDWRRGFQDELYETAKKYHKTTDCDARFKGRIMLSPKELSAIAFAEPSLPSIPNADMEDDSDWTKSAFAEQSDIQKHGGTYSWHIDYLANDDPYRAYQDLATFVGGKEYTFTCWVYRDCTTAKIGIDDGIDESLSDNQSSGTTWEEQLTVTKTLSQEASRLRLVLYYQRGGNNNAYYDDAAISGTAMTLTGSTARIDDFGSDVVVAMGKNLFKLNSGNFEVVNGFDVTITDIC
ncbi:unnamed protein product, partial [marine sediment metagenome]